MLAVNAYATCPKAGAAYATGGSFESMILPSISVSNPTESVSNMISTHADDAHADLQVHCQHTNLMAESKQEKPELLL
jgi:hypothetical protein